jgi:hypothetical protein
VEKGGNPEGAKIKIPGRRDLLALLATVLVTKLDLCGSTVWRRGDNASGSPSKANSTRIEIERLARILITITLDPGGDGGRGLLS